MWISGHLTNMASPLSAQITSMVYRAFTFIPFITWCICACQEQSAEGQVFNCCILLLHTLRVYKGGAIHKGLVL